MNKRLGTLAAAVALTAVADDLERGHPAAPVAATLPLDPGTQQQALHPRPAAMPPVPAPLLQQARPNTTSAR